MTNKTIARKRKAIANRAKKVGSLGMGASLLLGGAPALANSAAFSVNMGAMGNNGSAFQGVQHHALPVANLNHAAAGGASLPGASHAFGQAVNSFNSAHLHASSLQNAQIQPGWQHGGGLAAVSVPTLQKLSIGGGNLDLQSANANVVLGAGMFNGAATATIVVGGVSQTFHPGQKATAAEYVALTEVLGSGAQTLTVNAQGVAVGGDFSLNTAAIARAASIVIPANVIALDNIASSSSAFSLKGDLLNYGSLVSYTANSAVTSGTITARDIVNEAGASISTQSQSSPIDLTLIANRNFSNAGTVVADGSLSLVSGSGNFANSGLVKSIGGNINLDMLSNNTSINVTAGGGSFQAQSGDINIRNAAYNGGGNVNFAGGDYLSNNLNINSGTGAINGNVGKVSGAVNSVAAVEHLQANTSNLVLGTNTVDGDPTFVNNGDITISGVNTFTEDVLIVANGNILSSNGAQIVDHGHNVTLVAGVLPQTATPSTPTIKSGFTGVTTNGTIDFSSASNKGGDINFAVGAANTPIDTSGFNTNGGNVVLAAYANGSTGGAVRFDGASTINTATTFNNNVGGNGGNVSVYAGGAGGVVQTVNLGNITTSGGGQAGSSSAGQGGSVTISTQQPISASGNAINFNTKGQLLSDSIIGGATVTGAAVNIGGTINTSYQIATAPLGVTGGAVAVTAGGNLNMGPVNTSGGTGVTSSTPVVNPGAGGSAGTVTLNAGGTLTVTGDINANGGAGGSAAAGSANGASGGNAGAINVVAAGNVSMANVNVNGGAGGNGGVGTFINAGASGGAGGGGSTLSVTSQGTGISIGSYSGSGGNGGKGGAGGSGFVPTAGGAGGIGGNAGTVTLQGTSLLNVSVSGAIIANGGTGGVGGTGAPGSQSGPSSGNAGASGGAGGSGGVGGGVIINTPSAFFNNGNSIFSVVGGNGGAGGVGGNGAVGNGPGGSFNIGSGSGGNGGTGGNAGTIGEQTQNLTSNFNLLGGVGGAGGAAGTMGAPLGLSGTDGENGQKGSVGLFGSGTISSPIVANNIHISAATGSNGSVAIAASLTADNQLILTSDGSGTLSVSSATLTAQDFIINASSGDFNTPLKFTDSLSPGSVRISAPNGSVTTSFDAPVNLYGVTAKNDVVLTGQYFVVPSGSTVAGGTVTINASSGSDLTVSLLDTSSSIVASTGDVKINGAIGQVVTIQTAGLIQSLQGNIDVTTTSAAVPSPTLQPATLFLNNGGTMQVGATGTITLTADPGSGNPALAHNLVYISGNQNFIGNTVINATGPSGAVLLVGANITADSKLTFNTELLGYLQGSTITANPFVLNAGTAAGTIAVSGDLDLSTVGSLTFTGSNLAILASGSITDGGKSVAIDTSNASGAGGAVSIVGGFAFTSSPGAGPTYPVPDTNDTFTLGAASTGTKIDLAHTSINTAGSTYGGFVQVYGAGSVALGAITSKGVDAAGAITVFGDGVSIGGAIDASSSTGIGGSVSLFSGAARPNSGDTLITNGALYGAGFSPATSTGSLLTHSINADGVIGGGSIQLYAGGTTTFNVGSTAKTNVNGVVGTLSAAGPGGSLYIYSNASGVTNSVALNNFQRIDEEANGTGSLSLGSSLSKNTQLQNVYLSVNNGKLSESGSFTTENLSIYISTGSIGTAGAGFAVNAATVNAGASEVVNIKDASTNVEINNYNATSGVVKFVGAGNITVEGGVSAGGDLTIQAGKTGSIVVSANINGTGKTSLIAGGTGSITAVGTPTITGGSIVLTSKSGAIGGAANPLNFATKTLTVTSTGATYLQGQGSDALTFNGSTTTGAFSLNTASDITVAKPIAKATSIDIESTAGLITTKGAVGGTTTDSIILSGQNGIVGSGALTTKTTGLVTLRTVSGSIGTGALGASTALKVNTGNLAVTQGGTGGANIVDSAKVAVNLAASKSDVDFNLKTAQGVTLNGITAGGNINILATTGALTTAKNSTYTTGNGSVLLEEFSTSGTIFLNTGTTISTHSNSGTGGNVVVSIGAPPVTVAPGTTPTNVTVNNVSGGSAFFGNGITANANGGGNVINLKGSNVTFNIGKAKATAITLDGDVTITADPIVAPAAMTIAPIVSAPTVEVARTAVAAPPVNVTAQPVASTVVPSANSNPADSALGQSNLAARSASMFAEPGWISATELVGGEIPASISSGVDLGLRSNVSSILDMEEIEAASQIISGTQSGPLVGGVSQQNLRNVRLSRGSVVFAPSQNTVVRTPMGEVNIAAGSLVLVIVTAQGTAVYSLHDSRTGAVSVAAAGSITRLAPGAMLAIAPNQVRDFAEVNPAQMVGYSNLRERKLDGTTKMFAGQFSLSQTMAAVLPLRQLVLADNVNARKLSAKILKTSAILQQLNGARYEQVIRPVKTAWAN